MAPSPLFSLVLPCFNEAGILRESMREILETLEAGSIPYEIILVDDGSRDGTGRMIERIIEDHPGQRIRAIHHDTNLGRGACVSEGIRAARGEFAGFLDIDLETHCRHIPEAIRLLRDGADLVVARRIPKVGLRNLHRHILSRGYSFLVHFLLELPFHDTEAGFKFFRRRRILPVLDRVEAKGWFWDTEVMTHSHRARLQVIELPCPFVRRTDHASTVRPLRDSGAYLRSLLIFRRRLVRVPHSAVDDAVLAAAPLGGRKAP